MSLGVDMRVTRHTQSVCLIPIVKNIQILLAKILKNLYPYAKTLKFQSNGIFGGLGLQPLNAALKGVMDEAENLMLTRFGEIRLSVLGDAFKGA